MPSTPPPRHLPTLTEVVRPVGKAPAAPVTPALDAPRPQTSQDPQVARNFRVAVDTPLAAPGAAPAATPNTTPAATLIPQPDPSPQVPSAWGPATTAPVPAIRVEDILAALRPMIAAEVRLATQAAQASLDEHMSAALPELLDRLRPAVQKALEAAVATPSSPKNSTNNHDDPRH